MSRIKSILFDLDGTLLNTNLLVIRAFQHTLQKHLGITVSDEELYPSFGEPLTDTLARYNPDDIQGMLATYRAFDFEHHDELASFFPGAPETIKKLAEAGIKLAVVTSKHRYVASQCSHLPVIEDYLKAVITFDDVTNPKPDPEPILKALDILREKPARTLMVGDSPPDIQSARNAGTRSAVVGWSVFPFEVLVKEDPDYFINRFEDLLHLIK